MTLLHSCDLWYEKVFQRSCMFYCAQTFWAFLVNVNLALLLTVSILSPFMSCLFLSASPLLPPSLSQHLWMISGVRWKPEEDTRPARHIHLSFRSFYSPICSLCLSVRFLCVLSAPAPIVSPEPFHNSSSLLSFCPLLYCISPWIWTE